MLVDYCDQLTKDLHLTHQQIKASLPQPLEGPGHKIGPGDWVLIKNFQRKSSLQPRWKGPVQVLLATQTAVKVEGKKNWIHVAHCKRAPIPLPFDQWIKDGIPDQECETIPTFVPFSDARLVGEPESSTSDSVQQTPIATGAVTPQCDTKEELLFQDQQLSRYNLRPRR